MDYEGGRQTVIVGCGGAERVVVAGQQLGVDRRAHRQLVDVRGVQQILSAGGQHEGDEGFGRLRLPRAGGDRDMAGVEPACAG